MSLEPHVQVDRVEAEEDLGRPGATEGGTDQVVFLPDRPVGIGVHDHDGRRDLGGDRPTTGVGRRPGASAPRVCHGPSGRRVARGEPLVDRSRDLSRYPGHHDGVAVLDAVARVQSPHEVVVRRPVADDLPVGVGGAGDRGRDPVVVRGREGEARRPVDVVDHGRAAHRGGRLPRRLQRAGRGAERHADALDALESGRLLAGPGGRDRRLAGGVGAAGGEGPHDVVVGLAPGHAQVVEAHRCRARPRDRPHLGVRSAARKRAVDAVRGGAGVGVPLHHDMVVARRGGGHHQAPRGSGT